MILLIAKGPRFPLPFPAHVAYFPQSGRGAAWHWLTLACCAASDIFSSTRSKMFSHFQSVSSQRSDPDPKQSQNPISLPLSINPTIFCHLIARCFFLRSAGQHLDCCPQRIFPAANDMHTHTLMQIFYGALHNYILKHILMWALSTIYGYSLYHRTLLLEFLSPTSQHQYRKDQLNTCDSY